MNDLETRAMALIEKHSGGRHFVEVAKLAVQDALSEADKLREELARERELVGRLMSPVHIPNPVKRRDFTEEATRHD